MLENDTSEVHNSITSPELVRSGIMTEAVTVPDLIPQLLEANWDTVLTEVPRALGPLYQQARSALQQLLHTEECLLSAVQPEAIIEQTFSRSNTQRQQRPVSPRLPPLTQTKSHLNSTYSNTPVATPVKQKEQHASDDQLCMSPSILAACECGRPVVFGAPHGWEIVPEGCRVTARRTVSGKNRCASHTVY